MWRYSFADWDETCEMIEATNWMALLNHSDIDQSWLDWKNAFMNIMKECIPKTTILPRRNRPWLTKRLRQTIRRKNALYKRAKATINFSVYRNEVTSSLRQAKKEYFQKLNAKNSKQLCSIAHTNKEKAEVLNSFFASCFNKSILNFALPRT